MSCTECWNCNEELDVCTCGQTETYNNGINVGAICPYCGYLNEDSGDGEFYTEEERTEQCSSCRKSFNVIGDIDWSWKATKQEAQDEEE